MIMVFKLLQYSYNVQSYTTNTIYILENIHERIVKRNLAENYFILKAQAMIGRSIMNFREI